MRKVRKLVVVLFLGLSPLSFAGEPVNINTADKMMLMSISGIGEKRAEDIISYREANGAFDSVQDLTNVSGIGQSMVDRNEAMLTVDEPAH